MRELITKPVPHTCAPSLCSAAHPFCAQQPQCCKTEVQCWVTLRCLRGPGAATQRTNLILIVQHPNFNLKDSSLPFTPSQTIPRDAFTYANPGCSRTQGQRMSQPGRTGRLARNCCVVVSHTGLSHRGLSHTGLSPPFLQVLMGEVLVPTTLCLVLGGSCSCQTLLPAEQGQPPPAQC